MPHADFLGMRLVGLLVVVAIIGFFWSRRGRNGSASEIDEILATPAPAGAAVSNASASNSQAQPASSGLRRPIDRTRSVLEKVKGRNGNGEF